MKLIICFFYVLLNFMFSVYEFYKRYISAGLLFSLSQLLMFCGIFRLCDLNNPADLTLLIQYFIGFLFFSVTYLWLSRGVNFKSIKYNGDIVINIFETRKIMLMIIVSTIISISFFIRSGVNVINLIFSGLGSNISQMRKAINYTSGNGIVYQLRNFILPLSVIYLCLYDKKRRKVGLFFFPIMTILLIGSGQRTGIVYIIMIIGISVLFNNKLIKNTNPSFAFIREIKKTLKKNKKRILLIVIVFVLLFSLLTVLNGRDQISGSTIKAILDRFLNDNQSCAILAFRYIYSKEIVFGADWGNMFLDLFRVNRYTPVSALIHAQLYGSLTGTAPPCIWGSAYYNFGYVGTILIGMFSGFICAALYVFLCKKETSNLRLLFYIGMFVLFSMWISDSPIMLLNGGFATILMMNFFMFSKVNITVNKKRLL